jgi:GNAT superfamily N-acetyltransferase
MASANTAPTATASAGRSRVRKMADEDVPGVVSSLARAFYDDPVVGRWSFPDDSRRMKRLERGFDLYTRRIWLRHGSCYTTEGLGGAAMWMPPGTWHMSSLEQLRLLPAMLARFGTDHGRLIRLFGALEARHPHDPHHYLPAIGVDPGWQGEGIGTALLQPVLEECDREGLPAYLESSNPRNIPLYERHGFAVTEEASVGDSPPFWRMWREPRG